MCKTERQQKLNIKVFEILTFQDPNVRLTPSLSPLWDIQKRIVRGMCEMRISTPYIGLLSELGIWPVEQLIQYRQILLLHNIITSKEERLIKEIVEDQILYPWEGCWFEGIEKTCRM